MTHRPPRLHVEDSDSQRVVYLHGEWTLSAMPHPFEAFDRELRHLASDSQLGWNLEQSDGLDSTGALLLWRAWGRRWPKQVALRAEQRTVFERIITLDGNGAPHPEQARDSFVIWLGLLVLRFVQNLVGFVALIGQATLDFFHVARHPGDIPWREISATFYKSGVRALPVTALVGFLIGIVLSYLSALQLKTFGADVFIINILGISIIRELGPVLVAVLVAGRSGSAITAQIGVMRVTEEIDALVTMGVSRSLRLIFPKLVALAIVMPLLVMWVSTAALAGGMVSAHVQLGLSFGFFADTLPKVVPVANLWIGLAKGVVFGIMIALVACHFGLQVRPNTESLSTNTTASVVTAITTVILADAVFAIMTRHIGIA